MDDEAEGQSITKGDIPQLLALLPVIPGSAIRDPAVQPAGHAYAIGFNDGRRARTRLWIASAAVAKHAPRAEYRHQAKDCPFQLPGSELEKVTQCLKTSEIEGGSTNVRILS